MKQIYFFAVFLQCLSFLSWANDEKTSTGALYDKRDVQDFHKIHFAGNGNLHLQQGDHEVVQVVADESLLPYITTEVIEGTLHVGEKTKGWLLSLKSFEPYHVYITVKNIDEISFAGKGRLTSDKEIKGEKLILNISGSAKVDSIMRMDTLDSNISGAADFHLKGTVTNQIIHVTGKVNYDALKLVGKNVQLDISGYGDFQVNVQDKLDIAITGKGNVTYMGKPKVTQKILGTGRIEELK